MFINYFQIVHWRNHLRFPEDARLSPEAKDLICRLLCDVDHRLGTGGAHQIKVRNLNLFQAFLFSSMSSSLWILWFFFVRLILGSRTLYGINYMKWRQHLNQKSMESWTPRTLWNLMKYYPFLIFTAFFLVLFYHLIAIPSEFRFIIGAVIGPSSVHYFKEGLF